MSSSVSIAFYIVPNSAGRPPPANRTQLIIPFGTSSSTWLTTTNACSLLSPSSVASQSRHLVFIPADIPENASSRITNSGFLTTALMKSNSLCSPIVKFPNVASGPSGISPLNQLNNLSTFPPSTFPLSGVDMGVSAHADSTTLRNFKCLGKNEWISGDDCPIFAWISHIGVPGRDRSFPKSEMGWEYVWGWSEVRSARRVVFPEPLGPKTPQRSPRRMVQVKSVRICRGVEEGSRP